MPKTGLRQRQATIRRIFAAATGPTVGSVAERPAREAGCWSKTRFDIDLLTKRLCRAARWLGEQDPTTLLPLGLFGASTGAAAALRTAADPALPIAAVVARGGRPDLAGLDALHAVAAPTLLIVGGNDHDIIALNRQAWSELQCLSDLVIVPGAGHVFEETGALEEVARLATDWFATHFVQS